MRFGDLLLRLIESRGYTQRGFSKAIGVDCGNLNKTINSKMNAPRSPKEIWGYIGILNPDAAQVRAFMEAAKEDELESVREKWKEILDSQRESLKPEPAGADEREEAHQRNRRDGLE